MTRQSASRQTSSLLPGLLLLCGFLMSCSAAPRAADIPAATTIAITGHVGHPGQLTVPDLQRLPVVTVTLDDPKHPPEHRTYAGALLWTVLMQADPIDEAGPKTHLRHTLLVSGRDGYAVALSIGEIDPDFEGKQVIIAYSLNGVALSQPRLVVPSDTKQGRSVHDLASIELR